MPNALAIAGSDSVGGAGLQADLKAFEALGVHGCSVVTCVTSQNTKGVSSIFPVPVDHVLSQLDSVLEDVELDAVKTGMLYSGDIVTAIASRLKKGVGSLVVDPVLQATTGASLHSEGLVNALMRKLVPVCSLITPNLYEAQMMTGIKVTGEKTAREAAEELLEIGAQAVLIKGGHLKGEDAADYLYTRESAVKLATPRVPTDVHGTGCALASLIAGELALGNGLEDSVRTAKRLIYRAIVANEKVGKGIPCANPLANLREEAKKADMLEALEDAGSELETVLNADLVPEVGSNMGYAMLAALEPAEVAAFDGRIVRVGAGARKTGSARFGASKHVARIVLAAGLHDSSKRCALNIKYSKENLEACRAAKLSMESFSRAREPRGVKSMTWGVHKAIFKHGSVPDAIFDKGGLGKEPMIRLLGDSPADVVAKLKRLKSKRQ